MAHIYRIIIISLMLVVLCYCQQQDQVQFLPINNWNCSSSEQICAAHVASSDLLKTSSMSECIMLCWMKLPDCLQLNYYTSPSRSSAYCLLYNYRPKKYYVVPDSENYTCQHYVRSPDVPRSCLDHHLNGYNETGIYTVFTEVVTNAIRDIYCYMPAAPWTVARDCADILATDHVNSGVYTVNIRNDDVQVYCDMTTDGGGWLVFQRRKDGSEDFYRLWDDYKYGFGNLEGEFWLGLRYLHRLTTGSSARRYELRVDLEDFENQTRVAVYSNFTIASSNENFRLDLGAYNGDAGDSLGEHNGRDFSTKDKDNDLSTLNCAVKYGGAWWYAACHSSNLNGLYHGGQHASIADGVNWYYWREHNYSLKFTEMKIRPVA